MSFAINPAIDLVMLCALGELIKNGPLGFQLIVLNLINLVGSAPHLLLVLTALCPVQLQLESILYKLGIDSFVI